MVGNMLLRLATWAALSQAFYIWHPCEDTKSCGPDKRTIPPPPRIQDGAERRSADVGADGVTFVLHRKAAVSLDLLHHSSDALHSAKWASHRHFRVRNRPRCRNDEANVAPTHRPNRMPGSRRCGCGTSTARGERRRGELPTAEAYRSEGRMPTRS